MKFDFITIGDAFEDMFVLPTELKVRPDAGFASGFGVNFELGEKIPLSEVDYEIGGSACNAAVGFSRFKIKSTLLSMTGNDSTADKVFKCLKSENVDTSNIKTNKLMKTNFSVIFRFDQGRTIFIYHGSKDYQILKIKKNVESDWIFLGPMGENTQDLEAEIVARVVEKGTKLAWNPGAIQVQNGAGNYKNLLKNTAVLFVNREEGLKFLNYPVRPSEEEVLRRLLLLGPKIVVMTNGKSGAKAYDGENFYSVKSLDVKRVDSTGAGDSFAVGFLAKLFIEKWNFEKNSELFSEALRWGIFNSNSVVQYIGAQPGLLTLEQIEKDAVKNSRLKVEIN